METPLMTRRRSTLAVAVMAGSLTMLSAPAYAAHGVNCDEFDTQGEAQDYFEENGPGDPEGLDSDDDGVACETLPAGGGGGGGGGNNENDEDEGGTTTTPSGGVAAGAGGMADPASALLPATGALLGTALLGAGFVSIRRRVTAN